MSDPTCTIDGCPNKARRSKRGWCEKHYMRWYRHGDPLATMAGDGFTISPGRRYRSTQAPNHPLAPPCGRVYVHRMVLFSIIGYGPHRCHWCSTPLTWRVNLEADHLDGWTDNNDPSNLVPACGPCNTGRSSRAKAVVRRARGWWSGAEALRPKSLAHLNASAGGAVRYPRGVS